MAVAMLAVTASATLAYANKVTFGGQGFIADGFGGYDLRTELCGIENGADADGPYLLWVLTATKATKADIAGAVGHGRHDQDRQRHVQVRERLA